MPALTRIGWYGIKALLGMFLIAGGLFVLTLEALR